MTTSIRPALGCAAVALFVAAPTPAQQNLRGRVFSDKIHGYQITVPKDWRRLPLNVEEKWIIGHFLSKKEFVGSAKAGDSLWGHKPYMKIIMFDDEVIKKYVHVEKSKGKTIKSFRYPYRDYPDYVKRNLAGGGFYFSQQESGLAKKIEVMRYQVKLEKLARGDKKRYIGWVYSGEGVKFAVEFEVLESQFKKLRPQLMAALSSFKFIKKTGAASTQAEDAILRESYTSAEWAELSAKERMDVRMEIDKARVRKMLARLPEGWKVTNSKHFLVLSNGTKKFTKKIVDDAEAYRAWLDKRFDMLSDEYAMNTVIRICKNSDEYNSYYRGSSQTRFNFRNREFVTYNDYSGYSTSSLFGNIYGFYMQDKAPELLFSAPIWLDSGLNSFIRSAHRKGRKLVFLRSISEFVSFAELRRMKAGSIKTAREIMDLDSVFLGGESTWTDKLNLGSQIATFFRFLEGPGKRLSFLKGQDFLVTYMQAVLAVARESDMKGGIRIGGMKEATTEEEEEQQARQRKARWKEYARLATARRAEFLVDLKKRIAPWSDKDWSRLERAYAAYHRKKTR